MPVTNGWSNEERVLLSPRFWTSGVPAKLSSCLAHVNANVKSSPWEYRLVAFTCSESYQLLPSGAARAVSPELNCGKGRNDWATVEVSGKPAYGTLPWNFPA